MIRIFIGYDGEETVAYHVLCQSILELASEPVSITPLCRQSLAMLTRERGENESTDFAISRFLVPYLCGFEGRAIFMDCDMLCRVDIAKLWKDTESLYYAVHAVKHDYIPKREAKFLGKRQTIYRRKNWSSLMVFNNSECTALTPLYVNTAPGLELHQFGWIPVTKIGELGVEWNHLVGEYEPNQDAKIVHFTLGTPCFRGLQTCEFSTEWYDCQRRMMHYNRIGEFEKGRIYA